MQTKSAARNIFFGGTIFFFVVFAGLVAHSYSYIVTTSTNVKTLTPSVAHGKKVWEENACIDCHTILGEGAYYAPELGNVWKRYMDTNDNDPKAARQGIIDWIKSMPSGTPGRRQMPHFNLSDKDLNDLVDFFKWTSTIKTQNWPPNLAG